MPSNITYTYRDSFTSAGTSFNKGRSITVSDTDWANAFGSTGISSVLQYTAPVGTSYEQIWDNGVQGDDNFGQSGENDFLMVVNRSSSDTLTLRFDDGGGSNHAYLDIPPGGRFMWYASQAIITSAGGVGLFSTLSAKFGSATDTVELLAFSVNAAFS